VADAVKEYDGAIDKGLEGVVACHTSISAIHGTTLIYRGYTIEDLAAHATFEEVIFLLWYGRLPSTKELSDFESALRQKTALPPKSFGWFHGLPTNVHPMDFLHAVVAGLSLHDPDANVMSDEATQRKSLRMTARFGTIIAAYTACEAVSGRSSRSTTRASPGTFSICSLARSLRRSASGSSTPASSSTPTMSSTPRPSPHASRRARSPASIRASWLPSARSRPSPRRR